ncbi:helix-turn-helix domain-containing protein [Actinacidiphila epipremni]|uniref:Helix-turn-helix transcriptional regulator n=1 Tax=Actinacidiphila epipremni TaxID=2053013 RepID=A0ABX0ZEQ8_9ACTN|nr:helix-turn-helix transcriptional regulator [Actinacidiphila epipremni]NJP42259.1 helix-turn-helix transcriptional regulator [Actinacidiphila epipremni]
MPHATDSSSSLPGDRLRAARLRRGLTQEALAARTGLSLGVIKKLERGGTGRLETYHTLARALGVRTSQLFDAPGPHHVRRDDADKLDLLLFRQAIAPPIGVGGRLAPDAGDEPDLGRLTATARTVAAAYHGDDYATVAELLPPLVHSAHATVRHFDGGPEGTSALRVRSDVLQMAGRYLTQVRAYDLAHIALRDAVTDALAVNDLGAVAAAVYQQGWLLMRQGRLDEAEQVSVDTAEAVEPRISRASRHDLGAWGKLLVHASAAAARNNRASEAREMLRMGRTAGAALAGGTAVAESSWGRFDWRTIAFQGIENHLVNNRPDVVLRLSERVAGAGDGTFMRRHLLDVAQAHAMLRQRAEALGVLTRLHRETPEWLRHQRMAAETFHEVQQAGGRMSRSQRELATFFDAP